MERKDSVFIILFFNYSISLLNILFHLYSMVILASGSFSTIQTNSVLFTAAAHKKKKSSLNVKVFISADFYFLFRGDIQQ